MIAIIARILFEYKSHQGDKDNNILQNALFMILMRFSEPFIHGREMRAETSLLVFLCTLTHVTNLRCQVKSSRYPVTPQWPRMAARGEGGMGRGLDRVDYNFVALFTTPPLEPQIELFRSRCHFYWNTAIGPLSSFFASRTNADQGSQEHVTPRHKEWPNGSIGARFCTDASC